MIALNCSHKLQKYIGFKENRTVPEIQAPADTWNGHLFSVDKKKGILFINHESYFSFAVYPIKKADLKDFHGLFLNGLIDELNKLGLLADGQAEKLRDNFGGLYFQGSINNGRIIALIKHHIEELDFYAYHHDTLEQWLCYRSLNHGLHKIDGRRFNPLGDWIRTQVDGMFRHLQLQG